MEGKLNGNYLRKFTGYSLLATIFYKEVEATSQSAAQISGDPIAC